MIIAAVIVGIVLIALMCQRMFWVCAFGLGAIAAIFTTIASVIYFQILAAIGFLILAMVLGNIAGAIADGA